MFLRGFFYCQFFIAKSRFFNQINPGKKNILVELPFWIIKPEINSFLCISEPSPFYRNFVRPIPVPEIFADFNLKSSKVFSKYQHQYHVTSGIVTWYSTLHANCQSHVQLYFILKRTFENLKNPLLWLPCSNAREQLFN